MAPEEANLSSRSAKARWARSKNGHCRCSRVGPAGMDIASVPFESWLGLRRKGLEGAAEVAARHADRLRLRFGLDQLVQPHGPFLIQHGLGNAVGEPRPVGER